MAKVGRWLAAILLVVLAASALTLLGMQATKIKQLATRTADAKAATKHPVQTAAKKEEVKKPAAKPAPAPAPAPDEPTAVTNSFVRLRQGPSTNTQVLAELDGGTTVVLLPDSNDLWQQVRYNGTEGWIYKSYLTY